MIRAEFEQYQSEVTPGPVIRAADIHGAYDRLLCYGYDVERDSWYVLYSPSLGIGRFIDRLHQVTVTSSMTSFQIMREVGRHAQWREEWPTVDLYPNKRVFPQHTDGRFARLMRDRHDYPLTFLPVDWDAVDGEQQVIS